MFTVGMGPVATHSFRGYNDDDRDSHGCQGLQLAWHDLGRQRAFQTPMLFAIGSFDVRHRWYHRGHALGGPSNCDHAALTRTSSWRTSITCMSWRYRLRADLWRLLLLVPEGAPGVS